VQVGPIIEGAFSAPGRKASKKVKIRVNSVFISVNPWLLSFIIFYLPREMAALPISWGELLIISPCPIGMWLKQLILIGVNPV